jgi:hypothetical protein
MAKTFVYLHAEKAARKDDAAVSKIKIYYAQTGPQVSIFRASHGLHVAMKQLTECNSIADKAGFIRFPTRATT